MQHLRAACFQNRSHAEQLLPFFNMLVLFFLQQALANDTAEPRLPPGQAPSLKIITTQFSEQQQKTPADSALEKIAQELEQLHNLHKASLVRVRAKTKIGIFNGTGFIVDQNGHIITASSLIPEGGEVLVEKDNTEIPAVVLGIDRPSSVALLRAVALSGAKHLQFRQGTALPQGAAVVILGFPFHGDSSSLLAIINGLDRCLPNGKMLCITHHRMNIPLTPGMIGSPVLDSAGQVAGLVTGTAEEGRLTFSLPTPALRRVLSDLFQHGKVRRGWLGLELEEKSSVETGQTYMIITKIYPQTPAQMAGLKQGDIIKAIDDREISDRFDLIEAAFYARVGQQLPVFINRGGADQIHHLTIVERPRNIPFVEVRKPPVISRVITVGSEN